MADNPPTPQLLTTGRFVLDTAALVPEAGAGVPAYLATDRQAANDRRVALLVSRDVSPRLNALNAIRDTIDNLMTPLGHGVYPAPGGKGDAYYIICSSPPGPPLSASLRAWPERALVDLVMRPIARALDVLQSVGVTHRSIRLDNVFLGAPGQPVTLGAAWAEPPAMRQPALFETPYSAMCHPAARGEGGAADDVYALGVLMLILATGRIPLAGQDGTAVIRAKLQAGSFLALARHMRLSNFMIDLLSVMLAEDGKHRPPPALLLDPTAARGRRVAARPGRSSQRSIEVNGIRVFEVRTLAFALSLDDKKAAQALRGDSIRTWLRRGLGDGDLASAIEELVRARIAKTPPNPRSDAMLVMRAIAALNPRMPLCWRGAALWPDGLAGLLAAGFVEGAELRAITEELVAHDVIDVWVGSQDAITRKTLKGLTRTVSESRRLLQSSGGDAMLRLFYTWHPLLPCRIPAFASAWIIDAAGLLLVLDKTVKATDGRLIDWPVASFISARADTKSGAQVGILMGRDDPDQFRLGEVGLLRDLQKLHWPKPLPALTAWVVARVRPELEKWLNKTKRAAIEAQLEALTRAGNIEAVLQLVIDPAGRAADRDGARRAAAELKFIDQELALIRDDSRIRRTMTEQYGHALTGAIGLIALVLAVVSLVGR